MVNRRLFLIGATVVAAGLAGASGYTGYRLLSDDRPLALVYRGPVSCDGCSETVAKLLENSPLRFRTAFCGPDEKRQISAQTLAEAVVYAQPGGGQVRPAWNRLREHADDIRGFVRDGGNYLGFCLGAYLAGDEPGFGLLPGITVDGYVYGSESSVRGTGDAIIEVRWRGQERHMYFQDGTQFRLSAGTTATVLATYDTGTAAALVADYGAGRVGVVGPHPEADRSWYDAAGLTNPDGIRPDLGYDLIESTVPAYPGPPTR
ncbi:BPL-N domain-containing protein [Melissospora conviva]|uniref:BPL-N domain-containing protein n=1 Tax=Melissospora conviva TaxID=3388432 RepID=UPI003B7ED491